MASAGKRRQEVLDHSEAEEMMDYLIDALLAKGLLIARDAAAIRRGGYDEGQALVTLWRAVVQDPADQL